MALQRAWTYLPLSPHHQLQIPKSGRGESSDACFSYLCSSLLAVYVEVCLLHPILGTFFLCHQPRRR